MAIFYTSDNHFGHSNILKYCPERQKLGSTVEEMNEAMIELWNAEVGPEDIVRILGDFSLSVRVMEQIAPRLNGEKWLIPGNHDACHPCFKKKAEKHVPRYEAAGIRVATWRATTGTAYPDGKKRNLSPIVYMCHIPFETERKHLSKWSAEQAFPRLFDTSWLLCGHVHDRWKIIPEKRVLNVGVDVWDFKPVRYDVLLDLMEEIELQLVTNVNRE